MNDDPSWWDFFRSLVANLIALAIVALFFGAAPVMA